MSAYSKVERSQIDERVLKDDPIKKVDDSDCIGVTFQCTSFGSHRAAEAYVLPDSIALTDKNGESIAVQYTGVVSRGTHSCISGTYEYNTRGDHNVTWQALVDVHPKIAFDIHHNSATSETETNIDVGPLALGAHVEYQMTKWGTFQKAQVHRKHINQDMSSSLSFAVSPTSGGIPSKIIKAELFKKSKKKLKMEDICEKKSTLGHSWLPRIDIAYTQALQPPSSPWKLDFIGYTQPLSHITHRTSQATAKFHHGVRPRTLIDFSHALFHDTLLLTVASQMTHSEPATVMIKAKHQKKQHKVTCQASWKPKRQGNSVVGISLTAKRSGLSFSIHASKSDMRCKIYRSWH